jgi:hypothetical protein
MDLAKEQSGTFYPVTSVGTYLEGAPMTLMKLKGSAAEKL